MLGSYRHCRRQEFPAKSNIRFYLLFHRRHYLTERLLDHHIDDYRSLRKSQGLDDADAKSQIGPELVAALSKFNQGWRLDEFLERKTQIFKKAPDVEAEGISKLQAQFFLQARAAYTSLEATEGSVPTVAIHILPDEIPNSIFSNIQDYMTATCVPLAKLVEKAFN
jgi:hypothetical protein